MPLKKIYRLVGLSLLCTALSACGVRRSEQIGVQVYEVKGTFGHSAYDSLGVSAAFAGRVGDKLLFAGGANFPDKPASEGGKKAYYAQIFVGTPQVESRSIAWTLSGQLPQPLAYGVSLQVQDTLYIAGGESPRGAERGFYRITLDGEGRSQVTDLGALPFTINNAAGAVLGRRLLLIGGVQDGAASGTIWSYDLEHREAGWTRLTELPEAGGYTQPVATALGDKLFVSGGFSLGDATHPARVHQGIHCLDLSSPQGGWHTQDLRATDSLRRDYWAGGNFIPMAGGILATGGVHTSIFEPAIERIRRLKYDREALPQEEVARLSEAQASYMLQPIGWYRFTSDLYYYVAHTGLWSRIHAPLPSLLARAGASPIAYDDHRVYLLQGELKPGIRTPQVVCIELKTPSQR